VAGHGIDATRAAMIEDIPRNLAPAAALGMTTIWLKGGPHEHELGTDASHIHHAVDDLADFLTAIAPAQARRQFL
jgi:putative hydrolase of the HAD superfamily